MRLKLTVSVGDSGDDTNGGEGPNDDGNGSDNDSNSSDDNGDDTSSSTIPTFSENVGIVPDMSGKEPVDYYRPSSQTTSLTRC